MSENQEVSTALPAPALSSVPVEKWLAVPLMSIVILLTVVGNVLVILAVFTYRELRQAQNFLIVSLACADMAVGLLVLPLQVKVYLTNDVWLLPDIVCTVFTTSDIFFCTASILNLAAIAVDRYCAIKYPILYASKRTMTTVLIMIAAVFGLSGAISVGPVLSWGSARGSSVPNGTDSVDRCQLPNDKGYIVFSALGSFYIPAVIIVSLYISIFFALRRRLKKRAAASAAGRLTRLPSAHNAPNPVTAETAAATSTAKDAGGAAPADADGTNYQERRRMLEQHSRQRQKISLSRERRALRTLGIIMGIFMLCWLPFFVVYLGEAADYQTRKGVYSLFVWLGYLNSAINPIIYTIFNVDFRKAFANLLHLRGFCFA
uniref:G_PROTEIN_RECEP_F1_2 domain-containing protein n=1 Tax=Macrostomum lignano TaxID=282301 RepID=A0A1I8J6W3_9PLAT